LQIIAKDYEDWPLKGPTSITYCAEDNSLIVADGGYFGSTNFNKPEGSLFMIEVETRICRPLLMNCLAYPSDFYYDKDEGTIYLAETYKNRIIRIVQSPVGVYHSSMFYQFNGRVGPSAVTMVCHEDILQYIFVARFEYQVIFY
jgi:hypothetical protein